MKKLAKIFYSLAILSLAIAPLGVGAADVDTQFVRSDGGGDDPIIKVKWEMNNNRSFNAIENTNPLDDDLSTAGAQFMPTGVWDTNKEIYICAIATDPNGVADVKAVYADIYYPTNILLGPGHQDTGCGEQHGLEIELQEVPKADAMALFCDNIRNNHSELPTFNSNGLYDYDEICGDNGELNNETAKLYCKYTTLKWEDPAGDYRVSVHAADDAGNDSLPLENYFEYLPLTSFEVDFSLVSYGNVNLNTHKIVAGNKLWEAPNSQLPTVRNTGNTRLRMTVWQDDMGLDQTTNGQVSWNVQWDAGVGGDASKMKVYDPFVTTVLDEPLELSEMEEMKFSIEVFKFPLGTGNDGTYSGDMTLGAQFEDFLYCSI